MENQSHEVNIEGQRVKFRDIASIYRNKILSGDQGFEPGDTMPPGRELAARHNTTRATISKVMEVLIAEGLLRSNGQYPPVVAHRVTTVPNLDDRMAALRSTGKILRRGETCQVLSADMVECPAEIAPFLRVEPSEMVLLRRRVTKQNGKPIAYSASYYPQFAVDAAPELAEVANVEGGARERAVYNLDREQEFGDETYTSHMASDEEKQLLELTSKFVVVTQMLRVVTMDDGKVIEVALKINEGSQPISVRRQLNKA